MNKEQREDRNAAMYFLAKYHSLSNAAEFIRSHGEEGFSFAKIGFNKKYLIENKKLAKKLNDEADQYLKMYKECNCYINDELHPDA